MTRFTTSHPDVELLKLPFHTLYEKVRPWLSFELVAEEYQSKLQRSAQHIPPFCSASTLFGFECPLTGTKRWGDFSFLMRPSDCDFSWNDASSRQFPDWVPIVAFIETCRKNHLFETKKVKEIQIELDVGSLIRWPPVPNLFFGSVDTALSIETIEEILYRYTEKKLSAQMLHQLGLVSAADFKIRFIGLMFARPGSALRVTAGCSRVPLEPSWRSYLQSFGVKLDTFQHLDILEIIKPFITNFNFALDIEESVSPRFGVTCFFGPQHSAEKKDRVVQMLSVLELKGLIDAKKRQHLLSWIGVQLSTDSEIKNGFPFILRRAIHRLKLIFSPQCSPEIKAYLCFDAVSINNSSALAAMTQGTSWSQQPLHILE